MGTFAIKADVAHPSRKSFAFNAQKTMYGGKRIAAGDTIFVFASENEGGRGLIARGVVDFSAAVARQPGVARQTPRVSITVRRTAVAHRPLGRDDLKRFVTWGDGQPETELNFKFYRQATNKIVGLSAATAAFLDTFFRPGRRRRADLRGGHRKRAQSRGERQEKSQPRRKSVVRSGRPRSSATED